jgi:2-polyprenyl-3-methyl-5-hydroxy-6-metoxy-1,4-benzoquinol methylase
LILFLLRYKPESIIPTLGNYDIITFWHNIKHLLEPWKVLEEASKKINPGGIILIATPNPSSFAFRLLGRFWPHIDAPRHINLISVLWDKKSLQSMRMLITKRKLSAVETFYYGPKPLKGINDAKELCDKVINT